MKDGRGTEPPAENNEQSTQRSSGRLTLTGRQRHQVLGRVVGRQSFGRKCQFIDVQVFRNEAEMQDWLQLLQADRENKSGGEKIQVEKVEENEKCKASTVVKSAHVSVVREKVVHLVGDHVPREVPLELLPVPCDAEVLCVFAAQTNLANNGNISLTPEAFQRYTKDLGTPGELSKPRLNDMLLLDLEMAKEIKSMNGGREQLPMASATSIVILSRGDISKPHDFGTKWFLQNRPKQFTTMKSHAPRSTAGRFKLFATWVAKFFLGLELTSSCNKEVVRQDGQDSNGVGKTTCDEEKMTEKEQQGDKEGGKNIVATTKRKRKRSDIVEDHPEEENHRREFLVLDIAGGGGKLSNVFQRHFGIRSIIVDPRKLKLNHKNDKKTTPDDNPDDKVNEEEEERKNDEETEEGRAEVERGKIEETLEEGIDEEEDDYNHHIENNDRSYCHNNLKLLHQIESFFDASDPIQKPWIDCCDVLIGLHCDGAVNEILKAACGSVNKEENGVDNHQGVEDPKEQHEVKKNQHGVQHQHGGVQQDSSPHPPLIHTTYPQKNFAICACCVFPKAYPRQLNDGTPVILTSQLNQWMIEECQRHGYRGELGMHRLPFDGANTVVYGKLSSSTSS